MPDVSRYGTENDQGGAEGGAAMSRPTPRPWRVVHHGKELSIEGPEGSDLSEDNGRKVVCFIEVFGVEDWDAENEVNFNLIVERVNGGEK